MIDRRSVGLGAVAALAAGRAGAAPDMPLFVSGPMSRNSLAVGFKAPPASVSLPETPLVGARGPGKLSDLVGKTWIVSLWAEWCAACLDEAPDLAAVARTHAGPSFGVVFVLTSSFKKLDWAAAHAVLAKRGAGDAPLLVEPHGGDAVMKALATQDFNIQGRAATKPDSAAGLPCNLLIDRKGRVRARSFGTARRGIVIHGPTMTEADKARALAQPTLWATQAGSDFATALAAGLLEKS